MEEKEWLILNYTIPKEPSRIRVSVWRKLKKCGSVIIGQSMWMLPLSNEHIDIFTEISNEILQNNGDAYILKGVLVSDNGSDNIVELFNKARDEEYKELLDKCEDFFREIEKETEKENFSFVEVEENEDEYNKLIEWHKKIAKRDFFNASLKTVSAQELEKCKQILDDFSNQVYELNNEN
ncbi:Chromate resistance protein ChrB [Lachnoclostridium phytofermentans]|uniref:Chromate resistance protein ChrB n=1 Tax=Lachnoclostridium phytofermentans TaxID=66219 RepID=UPI0004DF5AA0|nr:Chromate resistance protein ChrB [Lachnoclostridium phytofermentans]